MVSEQQQQQQQQRFLFFQVFFSLKVVSKI